MNRQLPDYADTASAVRVWKAAPEHAIRCTYTERVFPENSWLCLIDRVDMWWVSYPAATPKFPDEIPPPGSADVVCVRCLSQAIYTYWQGWLEANMEPPRD